ncbi:MAG TPA: hypothetical protein V6D07_18800 [Trichocoleus sp.]
MLDLSTFVQRPSTITRNINSFQHETNQNATSLDFGVAILKCQAAIFEYYKEPEYETAQEVLASAAIVATLAKTTLARAYWMGEEVMGQEDNLYWRSLPLSVMALEMARLALQLGSGPASLQRDNFLQYLGAAIKRIAVDQYKISGYSLNDLMRATKSTATTAEVRCFSLSTQLNASKSLCVA